MKEDTHTHLAELPASAQEDVLLIHEDFLGVAGYSGSQSSTRSSRRICSRPACTWVLYSLLHNPHLVCVSPGKKCDECANWSCYKVRATFKYQCSLGHKKVVNTKYRCKSDDPLLQLNIPRDLGSLSPNTVPHPVQEVGGLMILRGLCNFVSPTTDPPLSALPSSSEGSSVSHLPRVLMQKGVCNHTKSGRQGGPSGD
ncbi:hypothetical protein E2C01_049932 [Portunus trituberculatus]|uniref:Uncharacterized protein n=1 Tax=Portunus trituberculatus TaxID=210409 RepID=A0A5B7GF63_PORTR|nr:hypothetical protein [Portunus trituberculatus]